MRVHASYICIECEYSRMQTVCERIRFEGKETTYCQSCPVTLIQVIISTPQTFSSNSGKATRSPWSKRGDREIGMLVQPTTWKTMFGQYLTVRSAGPLIVKLTKYQIWILEIEGAYFSAATSQTLPNFSATQICKREKLLWFHTTGREMFICKRCTYQYGEDVLLCIDVLLSRRLWLLACCVLVYRLAVLLYLRCNITSWWFEKRIDR